MVILVDFFVDFKIFILKNLIRISFLHMSKHDLHVIYVKLWDQTCSLVFSQHPGGVEVLLENAGLEATYAFEDVGHSLDARDLLAQYYIGDVHTVS